MTWYHIVNTKSDSEVADRDAEDLLRAFSAALRDADVPVEAEGFYGRTRSGARLYDFALSPEAVVLAEGVLTSYDATVLAEPHDLARMEPIRRRSSTGNIVAVGKQTKEGCECPSLVCTAPPTLLLVLHVTPIRRVLPHKKGLEGRLNLLLENRTLLIRLHGVE
jgi:hypothetical protein